MTNGHFIARAALAITPFLLVGALADDFKTSLFARAGAHAAALMCGAKAPLEAGGGFAFLCFGQEVLINSSCSGANFFAVCWAAVFWTLSRRARAAKEFGGAFLLALTTALPFSIFANACRICAATAAWKALGDVLNESYFSMVHLGIGMANFAALLLLLILIINRTLSKKHGYSPST